MNLNEKIREYMVEHVITQKMLAEKIGISAHALGKILNGTSIPKPSTQGRILKIINKLDQSSAPAACSLKEATVEDLLKELTARGFKVTLSISSGE